MDFAAYAECGRMAFVMIRAFWIILAATALLLLTAIPMQAAQYPAYTEIEVNDFAGVIGTDQKTRLRVMLKGLREDTGIEMTVATIRTRREFDPASTLEAFATQMFNGWGIGDAARNDGVLVLVVIEDRQVRVELGSGFGRAWDSVAKAVIDDQMIPHFKRGDHGAGIEAGVTKLISHLRRDSPGESTRSETTVPAGLQWGLPAGAGLAVSIWLARRYARLRSRRCETCGAKMQRLDEVAEDEYLDDGSRFEEYLKSVDYDVWLCPSCGKFRIERYPDIFSRYGACRSCGHRTLETQRTTLVQATTSSAGEERIDYECRNCGFHESETRMIPMQRELELDHDDDSGPSFGGGSSRGGGGSGDW